MKQTCFTNAKCLNAISKNCHDSFTLVQSCMHLMLNSWSETTALAIKTANFDVYYQLKIYFKRSEFREKKLPITCVTWLNMNDIAEVQNNSRLKYGENTIRNSAEKMLSYTLFLKHLKNMLSEVLIERNYSYVEQN